MGHCTWVMKVFAALLACAAMVSARNLKLDELEVGFCDGANSDVLSLDNISVEPFPLVIATGETITLNVQITLNEPIPAGATVSLKIKREGLIPSPYPASPSGTSASGHVTMMVTSSSPVPVTSSAPPTSPMARTACSPSTQGSTAAPTPSPSPSQRSPASWSTSWPPGPTTLTPL